MTITIVAIVLAILLVVALATTAYLARRLARASAAARITRGPTEGWQRPLVAPPPPRKPLLAKPSAQKGKPAAPPLIDVAGGKPAIEPAGLPDSVDTVADSEVDGATLGSLAVRSASVRGDRGRRDLDSRTDSSLIRVLGEGYTRPTLALVVATGATRRSSPAVTALACRSLVTQLGRLGASLDAAWRADALDDLHELLRGVCAVVHSRLAELARQEQLPDDAAEVELTCLLIDLADQTTRRHLGFRLGGGNVLLPRNQLWQPVLPDVAAQRPSPGVPQPLHVATVARSHIIAVTTRAGARALATPDAGRYFAEQWQSGPRDLIDFLRQVSHRTSATEDDRTVVCLWDYAPRVESDDFGPTAPEDEEQPPTPTQVVDETEPIPEPALALPVDSPASDQATLEIGPPARTRKPRLAAARPRILLAVSALVVAAVVATILAVVTHTSTQVVTLPGGATITGKVSGGRITAVELADTADLGAEDPIGKPIHVSAGGGRLDGTVTISFPATVSPGLDPALDTGIAMRSPDTGNTWEYVGGIYDPATHRVSVQTTHFSDWIPFARDIHKLVDKAISFFTGLLHNGDPDTSCQGDLRGSPVADTQQPPLEACLTADGELQIANPHGFPLALTLPTGVTTNGDNSNQTQDEQVWVPAIESLTHRAVLLPGSNRRFALDSTRFDPNNGTVTGSVDVPTFVFDMADFLVRVLLPVDLAKVGRQLAQPTDKLIGCVHNSADALRNRSNIGSFLEELGTLIKTCYLPAASELVKTAVTKLKVTFSEKVMDFVFHPLDLIFNFDDYRHTADEVLTTAQVIAAGTYQPMIALLPGMAQDQANQVAAEAKSGTCDHLSWISWIPIFGDLGRLACKLLAKVFH